MTDTVETVASPTLRAKVLECLRTFVGRTEGLNYMVLATSDGYVIAHSIPEESQIDPRRVAAMAASFSGISYGLASETGHSAVEGSLVESREGFLVCRLIRTDTLDTVLLGVFDKSSNHGLAFWTLNTASRDIADILKHYN